MKTLFVKDEYGSDISELEGTSSVVQWLRFRLPKQGAQVRSGNLRIPHAMEQRSHMLWNVEQQITLENFNTSKQKQNSNND